jgi:hypothetical protein
MKFESKLLFLVTSMCCGMTISASSFQAEFMTLPQGEKKWGRTITNPTIFRSGNLSSRAAMAVDMVKSKRFVGKSRSLVRDELGDPDSYFFSDTIYAYQIMPYPGDGNEIWHLVFIPDASLKTIKEVKIHKKCCYSNSNN